MNFINLIRLFSVMPLWNNVYCELDHKVKDKQPTSVHWNTSKPVGKASQDAPRDVGWENERLSTMI